MIPGIGLLLDPLESDFRKIRIGRNPIRSMWAILRCPVRVLLLADAAGVSVLGVIGYQRPAPSFSENAVNASSICAAAGGFST
jgi:hypothetical protein